MLELVSTPPLGIPSAILNFTAGPGLFHVKHQNSGDLPGIPTSLGYFLGVCPVFTKTWKAAPWRTRPRGSSPNVARISAFQRLDSLSSGGSETIRTPPTFKNLAAHSAVTAGGPKDLAVTSSNAPERLGSLATTSARPVTSSTFDGAPGWERTSFRNFIRFCIESTSTALQSQRSSRIRPGSPPPQPKSKNSLGGVGESSSQQRANPSACATCTSTGAGPK